MAQTGYTPISIYYSSTASNVPTAANLVQGELAINTNDGKLYYEDSAGVVRVLASKSTGSIGGSTTQVQFNNAGSLGGSSSLVWDNSNGRLGIGNSSPAYKLVVIDTANAKQQITFSDNASFFGSISHNSGTGQNEYRTEASGGHGWFIGTSSTTANMTLDSSGNLGVGTSSPSSYGGSAFIKSVNIGTLNTITAGFSDEVTGTLRIAHASGQNIINFDTSNLCFQSGGSTPTERARITSGGNLLVGTTSSIGGKLQVLFDGTSGDGIVLKTNNATLDATFIRFLNSAGSTAGNIYQNGTTSVSYATSSDYRLKENIVPMTGALAKVAQLKPVTYKWKSDGSDGQGFIAHELQEVVPDCVGGKKDAIDADGKPVYQGIDTSFLVATLTKAIQEQQALIESLTTRLTALENK